jgi:hypothetical protein
MNAPQPKATAQTKEGGDPTTTVVAEPFEYIVIVGTESHHKGPANKAMFMHAALRELKTYPESPANKKVVLFFRTDYSQGLKAAFKAACLAKGVKEDDYKELDTKEQLIEYINSRPYRQIKQIDIFAHGGRQRLWFGLETGLDNNMDMLAQHFTQLKPESFSVSATITSYACQTANGYENDPSKGFNRDQRLNNSLARALSNATKSTVQAYMRKTNYEGVLGDAAMRQDYYEYKNNWKQWKDYKDAKVLTQEEKRRGKLMEESMKRRVKARDDLGKDKTTFDPEGALLPVVADTEPPEVPANLFVFNP